MFAEKPHAFLLENARPRHAEAYLLDSTPRAIRHLSRLGLHLKQISPSRSDRIFLTSKNSASPIIEAVAHHLFDFPNLA